MMKKVRLSALMITALLAGTLSACGSDSTGNRAAAGNTTVASVIEDGIATADAGAAAEELNSVYDDEVLPDPEIENREELLSMTEGVDLDLTTLSSTMVYSEVYNMMYEPEDFVGKIIRMDGTFNTYHDEETGLDYYACIIQDATACCAQGVEFIPTEDYSYPADYPEVGDWVTVTGVFDTYQEGDYTYCTLRNAEMKL